MDFKFILFTERVFKNKPIFILAHAYDFLCAIAYVCNNIEYINTWKPLSDEIFKDLLLYDSNETDSIPRINEYIELMKMALKKTDQPTTLIEQTRAILSSYICQDTS